MFTTETTKRFALTTKHTKITYRHDSFSDKLTSEALLTVPRVFDKTATSVLECTGGNKLTTSCRKKRHPMSKAEKATSKVAAAPRPVK